ncbi:uncharacterized protein [Antedon mediterranea]|uniref:uncharacterized protein n=1 Tax=Antedon mediterranea TaxID=105859 RepID=UPI003AF4C641
MVSLQHLAVVLLFIASFSYADRNCFTPLGMQDGTIPDRQLTASSQFNPESGPTAVRLNGPGSWATLHKVSDQWVQVDLDTPRQITGVVIRGNPDYNEFVMRYYVHYSFDGLQWKTVRDANQNTKLFDGNFDNITPVQTIFVKSIRARYIRIQPYVFHGHPSMQFELLGCLNKSESCWSFPCQNGGSCVELGDDFECNCLPGFSGKTCHAEHCSTPLGLESNVIPDSHLSASSYWSGEGTATRGRLHSYGWAASTKRDHEWFSVDLGRPTNISGVVTQGHAYWPEWINSYNVLISNDSDTWTAVLNVTSRRPQIFKANVDKTSPVKNYLPNIVTARYIRIRIEEYHGHPSLRLEILGCEELDTTLPLTTPVATTPFLTTETDDVSQPCTKYPCENGGTCRPIGSTSFTCSCPEGFTGFVCQDAPSACESNPCINGGWCNKQGSGFRCTCLAGFTGKRCQKETCVDELGMDKGTISDSDITATSFLTSSRPSDARPKGVGWMPASNDYQPYIQVDLGKMKNMSAIILMDYPAWSVVVTQFQLSYSADGVNWEFVLDEYGQPMELLGLTYGTSAVQIHLYEPITTRYIRVHPTRWIGTYPGMRFELLGCDIGAPSIVNDFPLVTPATGVATVPSDAVTLFYGLKERIYNSKDSPQVIQFDYEYFDYGDSYNPTTGIVTIKVPGTYLIFISATSTNLYTPPSVTIMHNNNALLSQLVPKPSANGLLRGEMSAVVDAEDGDRLWLEIPSGASLAADIINSSLFIQLVSKSN